jgi:hypothetical protein
MGRIYAVWPDRLRLLCALIAAFAFANLAAAQEVEAWFAHSSEAASYLSIKAELLALSGEERAALLGDGPLADRLAEGARKGVDPGKLEGILRGETALLISSAEALRERALMPSDRGSSDRLFDQLGIAFREGSGLEDFVTALDRSIARLGRVPAAADRALAALSAVAGVKLEPGARLRLIVALASSSLPDDKLLSVRASLASQMAIDRSADASLEAVIRSLEPKRGSGEASGPEQPEREGRKSTAKPEAGHALSTPSAPSHNSAAQGTATKSSVQGNNGQGSDRKRH